MRETTSRTMKNQMKGHFLSIIVICLLHRGSSHSSDWVSRISNAPLSHFDRDPNGQGNDCVEGGNEECSRSRCNKTVELYRTVREPLITELTKGKAVHCSYRFKLRPPRDDWIVFIRFTKFRVGELTPGRSKCAGGYVQIIDGNSTSSGGNKRTNPGYFCGEIDMPKTYMAETQNVEVVFHSDNFNDDTSFQFYVTAESAAEFHQRMSPYHQLHSPKRRGNHIPGTQCDRVFDNCSPGHCYVQSPGFPEVYPRNLRCRFFIEGKKPSLMGLEVISFDVDGHDCQDSILMCFPRPMTVRGEDCPYDFIRIYDGRTEDSPIIATLCGWGRLATPIISTGGDMLLEFVTSPSGHLINTGFQLKAESVAEANDAKAVEYNPLDGSCSLSRVLRESNTSNLFTSLRSWYPPNTTCTYQFSVPDPDDRISLQFLWFKIERVSFCEENIRIYDSGQIDPDYLLNKLCDTNKPMGGASKSSYLSSGPSLLIQFSSSTGSLSGSTINYGLDVKRIIKGNSDEEKMTLHQSNHASSLPTGDFDEVNGNCTS